MVATRPVYGDAAAATVRSGRGGSTTTNHTSTADRRHRTAGSATAVAKSKWCASGGRVAAAMPTPTGWDVCRMPMASPRSRALNQPSTTRPLAAFTDAEAAPASSNPSPNSTNPGSARLTSSSTPVSASPATITTRSPNRSAAAPHAISASSRPSSGAEISTLAEVRDRPWSVCSAGMRNGRP